MKRVCLLAVLLIATGFLVPRAAGDSNREASFPEHIEALWNQMARVRVEFRERGRVLTQTGSGVFLDGDRFLSAGHVLVNQSVSVQNRMRFDKIFLSPWQGPRGGRELDIIDREQPPVVHTHIDLAELTLDNPPDGYEGVKVAEEPAKAGDTVYAFLMSTGRDDSDSKEAMVLRTEVAVLSGNSPHFILFGDAIPGDSGGAVVNESGELVGIIIGSGPMSTRPNLSIDVTNPFQQIQINYGSQQTAIAVDVVKVLDPTR